MGMTLLRIVYWYDANIMVTRTGKPDMQQPLSSLTVKK